VWDGRGWDCGDINGRREERGRFLILPLYFFLSSPLPHFFFFLSSPFPLFFFFLFLSISLHPLGKRRGALYS
jgi:hypothetical protein